MRGHGCGSFGVVQGQANFCHFGFMSSPSLINKTTIAFKGLSSIRITNIDVFWLESPKKKKMVMWI